MPTSEDLMAAYGAIMAIARAVVLLVDLFNLDERIPVIRPVTDRIATFCGGRKERLGG